MCWSSGKLSRVLVAIFHTFLKAKKKINNKIPIIINGYLIYWVKAWYELPIKYHTQTKIDICTMETGILYFKNFFRVSWLSQALIIMIILKVYPLLPKNIVIRGLLSRYSFIVCKWVLRNFDLSI